LSAIPGTLGCLNSGNRLHVTFLFQTKAHLQKSSITDVTEQCENDALPETKVGDAANSDRQNLPTNVHSCSGSLKGTGASRSENLHTDANTASSETRGISSNGLFTPVTLFVNSETALSDLVAAQHGSSCARNLMLTGLHACGNLSADILRLFAATPAAHVVCQVGCCYNLLSERFLHSPGTPAHGKTSLCSAE